MHIGERGRLSTLNELAAGMAKELGAPLEAAQAAVNQARAQLSDDSQEPLVALLSIDAAADQLKDANSVVARLRHVVEQPDLSHQMERVSLLAAARAALDLLQPELTRQGVVPKIELAGADFSVLAEAESLQQILFQLITNALQAMDAMRPHERRLTVALAHAGRMGHLTVQDNGPGIANNIATQIFEPFFTTRPGHLGLGLSQCETLASSMGGTLTAFNRVPRGAEFCLSLRVAG
jgi:C4-dicarboxylate-specific signal transduction histidine kinase